MKDQLRKDVASWREGRADGGTRGATELSVAVLRGESLHTALTPMRQGLAQLFAKLAALDAELSSTAVAPAQPSKRKAG